MSNCNCMGPQNGEPLCPCRMKNVEVIKGRYIEKIDHGPYPPKNHPAVEALRAYRKKGLTEKLENMRTELLIVKESLKNL